MTTKRRTPAMTHFRLCRVRVGGRQRKSALKLWEKFMSATTKLTDNYNNNKQIINNNNKQIINNNKQIINNNKQIINNNNNNNNNKQIINNNNNKLKPV